MRNKGFTLMELLVAMALMAVILTTTMALTTSMFTRQNDMTKRNDFQAEVMLMRQSISELTKDYSVDYQAYFEAHGPDADTCPSFDNRQIINGNIANTAANRMNIPYADLFSWDTGDALRDNLGGRTPEGSVDPCISVIPEEIDTLYLTHKNTNELLILRLFADGNEIEYGESLTDMRKLSLTMGAITDMNFKVHPASDPSLAFATSDHQTTAHGTYQITVQQNDTENQLNIWGTLGL